MEYDENSCDVCGTYREIWVNKERYCPNCNIERAWIKELKQNVRSLDKALGEKTHHLLILIKDIIDKVCLLENKANGTPLPPVDLKYRNSITGEEFSCKGFEKKPDLRPDVPPCVNLDSLNGVENWPEVQVPRKRVLESSTWRMRNYYQENIEEIKEKCPHLGPQDENVEKE